MEREQMTGVIQTGSDPKAFVLAAIEYYFYLSRTVWSVFWKFPSN